MTGTSAPAPGQAPLVAASAAELGAWVDAQPDLGSKRRPRYVRLAGDVPTTGTNKGLKRRLSVEKVRADRVGRAGDAVGQRDRGEVAYRPFAAEDEAGLLDGLTTAGRQRFWDL